MILTAPIVGFLSILITDIHITQSHAILFHQFPQAG